MFWWELLSMDYEFNFYLFVIQSYEMTSEVLHHFYDALMFF